MATSACGMRLPRAWASTGVSRALRAPVTSRTGTSIARSSSSVRDAGELGLGMVAADGCPHECHELRSRVSAKNRTGRVAPGGDAQPDQALHPDGIQVHPKRAPADRQARVPDLPDAVRLHSGETGDRPRLRVSRGRGARRVWERRCLPCIGDPGSRPAAGCVPEHLGEPCVPTAGRRPHAAPVRGYRRVIAGAGPGRLIVTLPAGGDGRLPGGLTRGPPRQA